MVTTDQTQQQQQPSPRTAHAYVREYPVRNHRRSITPESTQQQQQQISSNKKHQHQHPHDIVGTYELESNSKYSVRNEQVFPSNASINSNSTLSKQRFPWESLILALILLVAGIVLIT